MSSFAEKPILCQFASALPRNESFYLFNGHHEIVYAFITNKPFALLSAFPIWATGFKFRRLKDRETPADV